jgi:hypothetical protein
MVKWPLTGQRSMLALICYAIAENPQETVLGKMLLRRSK